jgi:hypothetical protein
MVGGIDHHLHLRFFRLVCPVALTTIDKQWGDQQGQEKGYLTRSQQGKSHGYGLLVGIGKIQKNNSFLW